MAIWDRALSVGELYTQYGAAVGGLKPMIFGDLQGPAGSVFAGDPLALMVDAGGTPPLTFTWYENGLPISTTSSNSFVIPSASLADGTSYYVTISNSLNVVTSSTVSVTVVCPTEPSLLQLFGYQNRTLYPGGTLSMAASATGGGLKYQWYKDTSPIASATDSAYTIPSLVAGDGGSYSLSITNSQGSITSGPPAVITIATVTTNSYEAAVIASAPEAWWRLDEAPGATNMLDSMGRHDGVYTNATSGGPLPTLGVAGALVGDPNTAASFSSSGKGIGYVPFSPNLNAAQFTVEAWVKTTVTDGQVPVSSTDGVGGWWWQNTAGNWAGFGPSGYAPDYDYNTNISAIIPGQWMYMAITYDATIFIGGTPYPYSYFWNGVGDGYVWTGSSANGSGPFVIGGRGCSRRPG